MTDIVPLIKGIAKIQRFLAVLAILGFLFATTGCVVAAKEGVKALIKDDAKQEEPKKEPKKKQKK